MIHRALSKESTMVFHWTTVLFCFVGVVVALPVDYEGDALWYLQNFNHLEKTESGAFTDYESVSSAIKDFQKLAGLTETGELNSETIARMNVPRCGVKNKTGDSTEIEKEESNRTMTGLTYRIKKYPIHVKDIAKVGQEISQSFKVWSDVTELCFKEEAVGHLDIGISFDVTEHEDEKSSGHAVFPRFSETAQFDNTEQEQKTYARIGKQFVEIAEEKFGRSLDLTDMSKLWDLMMGSNCKGFKPLEDDDIKEPIDAPDICSDASLDTMTRTQDGSVYAFKGDFYWKIIYDEIAEGYPRRIADDWGGLEGNLDASFTGLDGKTFFFKGGHYWSSTNKVMDSGYPKLISSGFKGIPDNLDAAITWGRNGKPYFFKGGSYWRYDVGEDPPVKDTYPLSITEWKGLPLDGIEAAVLWKNNMSYFFKRGYYYRFDDEASQVSKQHNYPLSTATEWFSCEQ